MQYAGTIWLAQRKWTFFFYRDYMVYHSDRFHGFYLIIDVYKGKYQFDFGVSCEQEGRYLNEGLAAQKEGFGARAVVYDSYRIELI